MGMNNVFAMLVIIIVMFVVVYFSSIKPQQKRFKEHPQLLDSIKKGNKIMTVSGLYGTILEVYDEDILIALDPEGVKVKLNRNAVVSIIEDKENNEE